MFITRRKRKTERTEKENLKKAETRGGVVHTQTHAHNCPHKELLDLVS